MAICNDIHIYYATFHCLVRCICPNGSRAYNECFIKRLNLTLVLLLYGLSAWKCISNNNYIIDTILPTELYVIFVCIQTFKCVWRNSEKSLDTSEKKWILCSSTWWNLFKWRRPRTFQQLFVYLINYKTHKYRSTPSLSFIKIFRLFWRQFSIRYLYKNMIEYFPFSYLFTAFVLKERTWCLLKADNNLLLKKITFWILKILAFV